MRVDRLITAYATGGRRLVDPDLAPGVVADGTQRILLASTVYLLSIGVSFVSPGASLLAFVLVPVLYIFRAQIEHVWLSVRRGDKAK